MKKNHFHGLKENDHGVTVIFIAVVLLVLIGMASLAIDIGYLAVKRNELQNAADAAALAAVRELGSLYPISNPLSLTHQDQVIAAAEEIAAANIAGELSIEVNIKTSQGDTEGPDAVNVILQKTVDFFFAKALGISSKTVHADATAALTSIAWIPVAIAKSWFATGYCGQTIQLYPPASDAEWHNFNLPLSGSETLKDSIKYDVLLDIYDGVFTTELTNGDDITFIDEAEVIDETEVGKTLFDWLRLVYESQNLGYYIDSDGNRIGPSNQGEPIPKMVVVGGVEEQDTWLDPITLIERDAYERELTTHVLVFEPSAIASEFKISGYAKFKINKVFGKPTKQIVAEPVCSGNLTK